MDELTLLGWSSFFEEQWPRWAAAGWVPARIAAEHRGAYEVWCVSSPRREDRESTLPSLPRRDLAADAGASTPGGATGAAAAREPLRLATEAGAHPNRGEDAVRRLEAGAARLAGRLRHEAREAGLPGVGDWVALDGPPGDRRVTVIEGLLDRRTVFLRGAAGRETRLQVVAANVDRVFVVCGLDTDFNLRRIERYLATVRASGARPVVLLNKADLCADPAARVAETSSRAPGVPVEAISALGGAGLEAVLAHLGPGTTAALVGSSGAGKSTLVNALLGEKRLATGAVRARDGRGRHVTSRRQLVRLPGGGLLLDTPGMRELQLAGEAGLDGAFEDVELLARRCRFGDCLHGSEPGCAVRQAIAEGELEREHLDHYLHLQREARSFERRHDARLRRQDERAWGRMAREVLRQKRWKEGEGG